MTVTRRAILHTVFILAAVRPRRKPRRSNNVYADRY